MNMTLIDWLMQGDPAVRWQTMRDLLEAPEAEWQAERQRTLDTGWGAQLLAQQDADGIWGGGLYSPKWISSTYTLLELIQIGIPAHHAPARVGAQVLLERMLGGTRDEAFARRLKEMDRCIVGMLLQIAAYFEIADARTDAVVDNLLDERMPDGGWNCRKGRKMSNRPAPYHSSFHTTANVLDGLRELVEQGGGPRREEILAAEQAARELLLQHGLVYSDRTGQLINPHFARLAYPYRWHYSLLRGLEVFFRAGAPRDGRLQKAVDWLNAKRRPDGLWPLEHPYAARVFFHMERVGKPSRWVTLRALRVLKWWEG